MPTQHGQHKNGLLRARYTKTSHFLGSLLQFIGMGILFLLLTSTASILPGFLTPLVAFGGVKLLPYSIIFGTGFALQEMGFRGEKKRLKAKRNILKHDILALEKALHHQPTDFKKFIDHTVADNSKNVRNTLRPISILLTAASIVIAIMFANLLAVALLAAFGSWWTEHKYIQQYYTKENNINEKLSNKKHELIGIAIGKGIDIESLGITDDAYTQSLSSNFQDKRANNPSEVSQITNTKKSLSTLPAPPSPEITSAKISKALEEKQRKTAGERYILPA